MEVSSWKEEYKRVQEAGGEVLCASADSVHSHRVFKEALGGLPYPLLADWLGKVAQEYDVWDAAAGRPHRSVFVIDGAGVLRYENRHFNARAKSDYDAVVEFLKSI